MAKLAQIVLLSHIFGILKLHYSNVYMTLPSSLPIIFFGLSTPTLRADIICEQPLIHWAKLSSYVQEQTILVIHFPIPAIWRKNIFDLSSQISLTLDLTPNKTNNTG